MLAANPFPARAAKFLPAIGVLSLAGIALCVSALLFSLPAFAQRALTLPRSLDHLVDESQTVVQGWVTGVTLQPHEQLTNLMTVVVSLQVEESLKGNAAGTYTFSQAVIDKRDLQQKMGYRVGQHLLLILIKPSDYGLRSPAGLEQGRFRIDSDRQGTALATNGFGNAALFRGLGAR